MYCAPPRRQNRSTILLPSQMCLKSHTLNCDSANPRTKRSAQRITISLGKRTFAAEINLFRYESVHLPRLKNQSISRVKQGMKHIRNSHAQKNGMKHGMQIRRNNSGVS